MTVSHSEYHIAAIVLVPRFNKVYNLGLVLLHLGQHALSDFHVLDE